MKIRAVYLGCTHYYAWCDDCGWSEEDNTNPEWVRGMVKKHIRETGHQVTIEKTAVTKYTPEN